MRGLQRAVSFVVIIVLVAAATYAGWVYWQYIHRFPHTRDAYVRANVVGIAAQIDGPIWRLYVADNQQVHAGDPLFEIDPRPFQAAARQAEANVRRWEAELLYAQEQRARYQPLVKDQFVPMEKLDLVDAKSREANAELELSRANLDLAELNLSYTKVNAPANGYVTNFLVRVGTYVKMGEQLFALVESDTWWISANFMETYLRDIRPGQQAQITIDIYPGKVFHGLVEGLSAGIYQVDGKTTEYGLPLVDQTIDWVRLAQRFPVRITITDLDADHPLRSGANAEVTIDTTTGPSSDGTSGAHDGVFLVPDETRDISP